MTKDLDRMNKDSVRPRLLNSREFELVKDWLHQQPRQPMSLPEFLQLRRHARQKPPVKP